MIYRTYPHAKAASFFSWTTGVLASLSAIAAAVIGIGLIIAKFIPKKIDLEIFSFRYKVNRDWIKLEIILIVFSMILMLASKYIGRKIAEKTIARKVRKSVKFAYEYCCENPYYYEYAASLNRDFKYKYARTSYYDIVERKNIKKQSYKR